MRTITKSKAIVALMLCIIMAFVFSVPEEAQAANDFSGLASAYGTVLQAEGTTTDLLNVRKGASKDDAVACILDKGQQVYIIDKNYKDGWYEICLRLAGKTYIAYVMSEYITGVKDHTLTPVPLGTQWEQSEIKNVAATTPGAPVFTGSDGKVIMGILQNGNEVYVIDYNSTTKMAKIDYSGYIGYISKTYVKEVSSGSKPQTTEPTVTPEQPMSLGEDVAFAGGTGSKADPYQISTAQQLNAVRFHLDKYFKLTKDIDLSDWGKWLPIGDNISYSGKSAYFSGSFDGDGHTIKGMNISLTGVRPAGSDSMYSIHLGLFGNVSGGKLDDNVKSIKNLTLEDYTINVNYTGNKASMILWTGALCATLDNGTISNCVAKSGKIKISIEKGEEGKGPWGYKTQSHIGGLIGTVSTRATLQNSANASPVTFHSNCIMGADIGGLVGTANLCSIKRSFNKGKITADKLSSSSKENGYNAGGLIGKVTNPITPGKNVSVTDCYNVGRVSGAYFTGGLVGYSAIGLRLTRCYNTGKVSYGLFKGSLYSKPSSVSLKKNCYTSGNSVSGSAWQKSSKLGRKILKAVPETKL